MSVLIALVAGLSVAALVVGVFQPSGASTTVRRRAERLWLPAPVQFDDDPFATRVIKPMVRALMRSGSRLLPQTLVSSVAAWLQTAGMAMSATQFVGRWLVFGVIPPLLFGAYMVTSGALETNYLMLLGAWLAAGVFGPRRWLQGKAAARTKSINKELPGAIDMIITGVEAGLGVQQAMATVAEKFKGAIGEEFGHVIAETNIGRPRSEALTDMAVRTGSRDVRLFVRAITQAEQMGISIGGVLRNQSSEIRERRRQEAMECAARIPVMMTIPTILLMLPTLFILILTPVCLNAMESFGG